MAAHTGGGGDGIRVAGDYRKAIESGFDEHLPKPLDPQRLLDVLVRLMNGKMRE